MREMPRIRPVFHPELGDLFRELRTQRGWTMRQAALLSRERGYVALTRQILFRLERGQIKNPEPEVLKALALLYEMPYEVLAGQFVARRYGLPISNTEAHTDESTTRSHKTEHAAAHGQPASLVVLQDQHLHARAEPVSPYDASLLAETRAEIERILADLTAVAKRLPRRQTAVARSRGSGSAARARSSDRSPHLPTKKKPARQ